nr:MAG TPA: hypothetical protein [Caudoviricetes sp.]
MNRILAFDMLSILAIIGWSAYCLSRLKTAQRYRKGAVQLMLITIIPWLTAVLYLTQTV